MTRTPFSALLLITLGCPAPVTEVTEPTVQQTVSTDGPDPVGHTTTSFTYTQRGTGDDRTIPVEVWYPAVDGGEPSPMYGLAAIVQFEDVGALEGADPLPGDKPLIVYSHGSGGVGALAYPYARRLASHGYVVVAPDHIGNTASDLIGGGANFVRNAVDRPADITALLDVIEDGTILSDLSADASSTLLFGHSFGGYTTLSAPGLPIDVDQLNCNGAPECDVLDEPGVREAATDPVVDDRIVAIVPQAPALVGLFEDEALAAYDLPMLLMSGERDQTTRDATEAAPLWAARGGEGDHWLRIPDGGHYSFITICDDIPQGVLDQFLGGIDNDGCGDDFTPVSELVPTLAAYTLSFAEIHVRGRTDFQPVFDGAALSEGIEFE